MIQLNNQPASFDSQVPTALILTSSESASSIDTQFYSLSNELRAKVKAKVIVIDEKKCSTTKSCMEHLIRQVYSAFGSDYKKKEDKIEDRQGLSRVNNQYRSRKDSEESGDNIVKDIVPIDDIEENDEEMEDDYDIEDCAEPLRDSEDPKNTSNYVSTIRNPSFGPNTSDFVMD